jgi:hypothetical protein
MSNVGTVALLHQAGATNVTLAQVEGWSERHYVEARQWAYAQLDADAHAEPGHSISVKWPDHVSQAQHGGKMKKTRRRKAR